MKKYIAVGFSAIIFILCILLVYRNCALTISDNSSSTKHIYILDAGHGGEDGGAVAADGTPEKDLNLSVSEKTHIFFVLFGLDHISVRKSDTSVCNEGLDTIRSRKISDIHNRYDLVNNTPNSILLSIHMNKFTEEKYKGTQVFYSPLVSESANIASIIQETIINMLQPNNKREVKPTNGTVYLLDKAQRPSVLIECGFLSNNEELKLLKNDTYQSKLSYFITRSIIGYEYNYRNENNGT